MAPSIRYLVVRALLFVLPFAVLMLAQVPPWLAVIVSLAFAFAASIVFFPKLRDEAAADLQRMREGRKRDGSGPDDGDVEDAAIGERERSERSIDEHEGPLPAADGAADGTDPRGTDERDERDDPEASARA